MREELKILNSKSHIGVLNSNKKKNGLTLIDNRLGTISQRKTINTIHKCLQGESFFPIQKNNTSTPASYLLERNFPLVIQRDYLEIPAHDEDGEQAGWWSIEDDLSVNIEHNGLSKWIPPHSLFRENMSGTRQVLRGGYTLIRYNSSNGITSEESDYADYSPIKKDGKTIHTEPLFYSNISNTLLSELNTVDCIGAIIEINQVNSICSTCQKYLASIINNLKTSTNKKIILRAQATKLYEAQGGEIATANNRYLRDRKKDDTGAIMDDLSDGEGWVGIHKFVPPYSGRGSFVSGEGLSDSSSYETPSDDDEYN